MAPRVHKDQTLYERFLEEILLLVPSFRNFENHKESSSAVHAPKATNGPRRRLTSWRVSASSALASSTGASSSWVSSKQSLVGVATFMTWVKYLNQGNGESSQQVKARTSPRETHRRGASKRAILELAIQNV
jgi:hypothetical protein